MQLNRFGNGSAVRFACALLIRDFAGQKRRGRFTVAAVHREDSVMKLLTSAAAVVAVLAGCDSRPIESLGYEERMQLAQEITERCMKLGIDPKSQQMVDCQNAEVEKEVSTRSARREGAEAFGAAMQSYSASQQAYYQQSQSRRINCTSSTVGWSTNTTCY